MSTVLDRQRTGGGMIPFEWPFLHRTIAEIDAAGEWDPRRDTLHHQPAPRRDDDGGEGISSGMDASRHGGRSK